MPSTVQKGDALRDRVYALLKAAQKMNCTVEKRLGGKKADVYYEDYDPLHKTHRIAVECKNYNSALNRSQVLSIIFDYEQERSHFDILIIVSKKKPPTDVQTTIEQKGWVRHFTIDEFVSLLVDFSSYLESLKGNFSDGLEDYYVPIRDIGGFDVEEEIEKWSLSTEFEPRAILAGYGMGKTSFAKNLAYKYADSYLSGEGNRIPIYIELNDIFHHQDLEGLLGKYFTSKYVLRNYSFPIFESLNKQGMLFIILDGFDEMKHAMSFSEFQYNIKQFNKLVVPGSKVLILGRPNAFTSEDEESSVLLGIKKAGDREIKSAQMRAWHKIEVGLFDEGQLSDFVTSYMDHLVSSVPESEAPFINDEFCKKRKNELLQPRFRELISRPVHAKMLISLSVLNDEELSSFSRYQLYDYFIGEFLEREYEKHARKEISSEIRKEFLEKVAWRLWQKGGVHGFTFEDISQIDINVEETGKTREGIVRDLVIGSVLERKGSTENYFYFAHRSFQEFLVAKFLLRATLSARSIKDISEKVNNEVKEFIRESGKSDLFAENVLQVLPIYQGHVTPGFIEMIAEFSKVTDEQITSRELVRKDKISIIVLLYVLSVKKGWDKTLATIKDLVYRNGDPEYRASLVLFFVLCACKESGVDREMATLLSSILHFHNLRIIEKAQVQNKASGRVIDESETSRLLLLSLIEGVAPVFNSKNELTEFEIKISGVLGPIRENVFPPEFLVHASPVKVAAGAVFDSLAGIFMHGKEQGGISSSDMGTIRRQVSRFWRQNPKADLVVPLEKRSREKKKTLSLTHPNK